MADDLAFDDREAALDDDVWRRTGDEQNRRRRFTTQDADLSKASTDSFLTAVSGTSLNDVADGGDEAQFSFGGSSMSVEDVMLSGAGRDNEQPVHMSSKFSSEASNLFYPQIEKYNL